MRDLDLVRRALSSGRFTTFRAGDDTVLFRVDGLVITLDDVLSDAFAGRTAEELRTSHSDVARDNVGRAIEGQDRIASLDPYAGLVRNLVAGRPPHRKCGVCAGAAAVSTEGTIYPCHRFVGLDDYAIGDISSGIAPDRANYFFAARDAASDSACLSCWARELCDRGCPFAIADGKGGFVAPSEDECVTTREGIQFAVEMLLAVRAAGREAAKRYLGPPSRKQPPAPPL